MLDNKFTDRQKKFAANMSGSSNLSRTSLIRRREEVNLNLRKNKLFDSILERRLKASKDQDSDYINKQNVDSNSHTNSKSVQNNIFKLQNFTNKNYTPDSINYLELQMKLIDVPKIIISNFEKYDEKLILISKLFSQNYEDLNDKKEYTKFAIYQTRKYVETSDTLNKEEMDMIIVNILPYLEIYLLEELKENKDLNENLGKKTELNQETEILNYLRLKYEITWVLIDLTSQSDEVGNKILTVDILKRLESLILECVEINKSYKINTITLIKQIFWIFSNLLIQDQQSNNIIKNTVNLKEKLISFLSTDSNSNTILINVPEYIITDLKFTLLWTIDNYIYFTFSDVLYSYKDLLLTVLNIAKAAMISNPLNFEILEEGVKILSKFTNCPLIISILIDGQAIPILIASFNIFSSAPNSHSNIKNVLRVFSEISTGNEGEVSFMLNYPILNKLQEILDAIDSRTSTMMVEGELYIDDCVIVKEVCLIISNICASNEENIEKIITNKELMQILLSLFNKFEISVKLEILFIFYNSFLIGSNFIRSELVRMDIMKLYISELNQVYTSKQVKVEYLLLLLKAIKVFLVYGGKNSSKVNIFKVEFEQENLPTILENLQFDEREEIFDLVAELYHKFWGESENYYNDPSDLFF